MIIMAGIIFIWPKQYLKYSIILSFSNDYIAYNQIRLFINSIKDRKYNRENLLEFLMFSSISASLIMKSLNIGVCFFLIQ